MARLIGILALFLTAAVASGCASPAATAESATRLVRVALNQMRPKPFSAESNLVLDEDEERHRRILSEEEQREALAAMRSIAGDLQPTSALRPAEHGMRWSDVPLAVRYAGEDVEMAIARQRGRISDDEITFILTTVDGRPAELVVTRTHDERVFEASAAVGRFGTDVDRAERFLTAFGKRMRELGRKRGFD